MTALLTVRPVVPALALVVLVALGLRPQTPGRHPVSPTPNSIADRRRSPASRGRRWARQRPIGPALVASWLDALAREVRSGATLTAAVASVDPPDSLATAVTACRLALERGTPLARALEDLADDNHHLRVATTVLGTLADRGGPAAEPLDRAAVTLRMRAAIDAERATQSAQARLSALVMTVLPLAVLALLVATSPSVRGIVASPLGAVIIGLGGGLNLVGWRWMRRIIRGGAT